MVTNETALSVSSLKWKIRGGSCLWGCFFFFFFPTAQDWSDTWYTVGTSVCPPRLHWAPVGSDRVTNKALRQTYSETGEREFKTAALMRSSQRWVYNGCALQLPLVNLNVSESQKRLQLFFFLVYRFFSFSKFSSVILCCLN